MAPSVTAVTRSSSKREKSTANGSSSASAPANSNSNGAPAMVSPDEREAIETKYRDFFWTYTEEPHRTRRLAIIKAHPEVRFTYSFVTMARWLTLSL